MSTDLVTIKDGYQLVKEAPFKSSIETTADVNTMNHEGLPTNSFSLYQYDANTNTDGDAANANSDNKKQEGAELEKWLKILLNHQAYGDGSNIVAEAVLKDTSLQQIPEPRTGSLYRRIEDETSTTMPSIGLLGYKTDFNGDVIKEGSTSKTESKEQKTLMESLAGSPIPTILAGLAAISPFFLAGGKAELKQQEELFGRRNHFFIRWISSSQQQGNVNLKIPMKFITSLLLKTTKMFVEYCNKSLHTKGKKRWGYILHLTGTVTMQ